MTTQSFIAQSVLPLGAVFLLTSAFECDIPKFPDDLPPNEPSVEDSEGPNSPDKPVLEIDRTQECLMLTGDNCHGYPGHRDLGSEPGDILPNFVTKTCDDTPFEFAQHFKLNSDGLPNAKSHLIAIGTDASTPCLAILEELPEFAKEVEPLGMRVVSLLSSARSIVAQSSTPQDCQRIWLKKLNSSPLGENHNVTALANPSGALDATLHLEDPFRYPKLFVLDHNGVIRNPDSHMALEDAKQLAKELSESFDKQFVDE